jgi:hypothetical protein
MAVRDEYNFIEPTKILPVLAREFRGPVDFTGEVTNLSRFFAWT